MKKLILIPVLVIVVALVFLILNKPESEVSVINVLPAGEPVFGWKYSTVDKEGIPQTTISILATYPDSTEVTKEIDTIEGECNEYLEPDADVYQNSKMIICYYAGLGHYFKVIEGDGKYLVQRKVFEEASPEYNPPVEDFETVVEF
jgi:hypothetical protein